MSFRLVLMVLLVLTLGALFWVFEAMDKQVVTVPAAQTQSSPTPPPPQGGSFSNFKIP